MLPIEISAVNTGYEAAPEGIVTIVPSAGIEVGLQFVRSFHSVLLVLLKPVQIYAWPIKFQRVLFPSSVLFVAVR